MNQIEILTLLEEIYELPFLESILKIQENSIDYKKTEYFKITKIPLSDLYEKYFFYRNSKYSFDEKMNEFITNIDIDQLTELSLSWLSKLESNENFQNIIEKFLKNFDMNEIREVGEEITNLFPQK